MKKELGPSATTAGRSQPRSTEEAKSSNKKAKGKTKPKRWNPVFLRLWFLHAIFVRIGGIYVALTDKILRKFLPQFKVLSEGKRRKELQKLLRKCKRRTKARMNRIPSNAPRKVTFPDGTKRPATREDYQCGATALLSGLLHLFPSTTEGRRILAIIVCAMRCRSIRERFPDFHPHLYVKNGAEKLANVFTVLIECIVTKRAWKETHIVLKRNPILDFRAGTRYLRKKIVDFSLLKVTRRRKTLVRLPAPYTDSIVLVLEAEAEDVKEIAPYLEDTGTVFLGGMKPKSAETAKASQFNTYSPDALQVLQDNGPLIAALLRWYWEKESEDWVERIEERVTASLSSGDSGRYVSVQYKPDVLRNTIYDVVVEHFLTELLEGHFLSEEECAEWGNLLWPTDTVPPELDVVLLSPTEPDTFLRIIRKMIADNPARIVQHGQSYREVKNPLGAWRKHKMIECFMMLEATFEKEFPKAAKALGNIDLTMFSHDWLHPLQDEMVRENVIFAGSNTRYLRFDLLENGTRNSTHVVATPKFVLDETDDEEVFS